MAGAPRPSRSICFVGVNNLPALAPEFAHLGTGGAELQQTLLARALARRGIDVSMVVADLGQPEGATWSGVRTLRAYAPHGGLPGSVSWSAMLILGTALADVFHAGGQADFFDGRFGCKVFDAFFHDDATLAAQAISPAVQVDIWSPIDFEARLFGFVADVGAFGDFDLAFFIDESNLGHKNQILATVVQQSSNDCHWL